MASEVNSDGEGKKQGGTGAAFDSAPKNQKKAFKDDEKREALQGITETLIKYLSRLRGFAYVTQTEQVDSQGLKVIR